MGDVTPISIGEQIACVEREIGFRAKLYPRWVATGKLTATAAKEETERMQAVLATLRRVEAGQDHHVPDADSIRRGERARVMGLLLPMVPSGVMVRLEKKLQAI